MTNKKSLFKNIGLIMFSTIMLVLSIFSIFINVNARKTAFNVVHADTTTTNFYGSSFYVPVNIYYYDMDYTWSNQNWSGLQPTGSSIWTDGVDYYYSYSTLQRVLDISTSTWSTMTWTGLTSFNANLIWTDGVDYYYSSSSDQYVLDVSTHTWSIMTWTGLTSFNGNLIWTDGVDYYYSASSTQYVLDVSTHTWSIMTWTGLTRFDGLYIWHAFGKTYYSDNNIGQYVLDVSTHTWSTISWTGINNFFGMYIWNIGDYAYYSNGSNQYVLDNATNNWRPIRWNNSIPRSVINNFSAGYVWNIGSNFYYSNGSNGQLVLDSTKFFVNDNNNTYFTSTSFTFIDLTNSTFRIYHNSVIYSYDAFGQVNYSVSNKLIYNDGLLSSDVLKIYDNSYYLDYFTRDDTYYTGYYLIPFQLFNSNNVKITACFQFYFSSTPDLMNCNFDRVNFDSELGLDVMNNQIVNNYIRYYNSDDNFAQISFKCNVYDYTPVYYYGDSSQVISYYLGFTDGRPTNDNYYFRFNPRTYYLTVSSGDSYNAGYIAGDTAGYNRGYTAGETAGYGTGYSDGQTAGYGTGYSDGDTAGYNRGYTTGYNTGDLAGYYRGYNDGGNASNTYTFLGLISAVIDAPIQAFIGLFNFNLLGVNMVSFITALFTLAVIITIIKKVV